MGSDSTAADTTLDDVVESVIAPNAVAVDDGGAFPQDNITALGKAGILGLISAQEVGGGGAGMRAAADVVTTLAGACGSTAMITLMHLRRHGGHRGPRAGRRASRHRRRQTDPYDHCNMSATTDGPALDRFIALLKSMSYADPEVRPLLDLEGLTRWVDGRTSGYGLLADAVDATGFYSAAGEVTAAEYRP